MIAARRSKSRSWTRETLPRKQAHHITYLTVCNVLFSVAGCEIQALAARGGQEPGKSHEKELLPATAKRLPRNGAVTLDITHAAFTSRLQAPFVVQSLFTSVSSFFDGNGNNCKSNSNHFWLFCQFKMCRSVSNAAKSDLLLEHPLGTTPLVFCQHL